MAAARPRAVASSASAMPGATTARLVVCEREMPMKEFMMPHTVPNRPTNGAVAPMVASTPVPFSMLRPAADSSRSRREATRSFKPSRSSTESAESLRSASAAATSALAGASSSEAAPSTASRTARWRRNAAASSRLLATNTVQVTTEATARPTITACTSQSAAMNMPHTDRSLGRIDGLTAAAPGDGAAGEGWATVSGAGDPAGGVVASAGVSAAGVVAEPLAWAKACTGDSRSRKITRTRRMKELTSAEMLKETRRRTQPVRPPRQRGDDAKRADGDDGGPQQRTEAGAIAHQRQHQRGKQQRPAHAAQHQAGAARAMPAAADMMPMAILAHGQRGKAEIGG